jgi:hypothetical protein
MCYDRPSSTHHVDMLVYSKPIVYRNKRIIA